MSYVLLYGMGSIDEDHGPAIPRDIDDLTADMTATRAIQRIGPEKFDYKGVLPFGSDRVGEIAKRWCPAWIPPEEATQKVINLISDYIESNDKATHAAIISGHGGNNFLKDQESMISKKVGIPFMYTCPFAGVEYNHPKYGHIEVEHATSGDHSTVLYMSKINDRVKFNPKGVKQINELAAKNPEEALKKWPPLCGLGGYILYGGPDFEGLRNPDYELEVHSKRFFKDKRIIADRDLGKILFNKNLDNTIKQIQEFISR